MGEVILSSCKMHVLLLKMFMNSIGYCKYFELFLSCIKICSKSLINFVSFNEKSYSNFNLKQSYFSPLYDVIHKWFPIESIIPQSKQTSEYLGHSQLSLLL